MDVILPAIAEARHFYPDISLDVIGTGPDLDRARILADQLGANDCVTFHGFLPDDDMHRIVASAAAGFALYDGSMAVHSSYTVSAKVHVYVACGTPVIINRGSGQLMTC